MPAGAKVLTGSPGYRIMFVALGVAGGVAPFGRDGPTRATPCSPRSGSGLCFGVLAGLFVGLLYLHRREAAAGELLDPQRRQGARQAVLRAVTGPSRPGATAPIASRPL